VERPSYLATNSGANLPRAGHVWPNSSGQKALDVIAPPVAPPPIPKGRCSDNKMGIFVWLATAPTRSAIALARLAAARAMLSDAIICSTCQHNILLLGFWQCSWCNYLFFGFFFSRCFACGAIPPFLNCEHCGASMLSPFTP
jgi:hypothetical protein